MSEKRILLTVGNYLRDHHLMGRPVLPAVEALQVLAEAVKDGGFPEHVFYTGRAGFLRFLFLPDRNPTIEVIVQLSEDEKGLVRASLLTESVTKSGSMTRRKEHITAFFGRRTALSPPPTDATAVPEGPALILTAEALYQDLVPFGPAFRNVAGPVHLSRDGAAAAVMAPEIACLEGPLGSPFPIDAAFHLACAWGQRFKGVVGFPVAFEERRIFRPVRPGERCLARIFPVGEAAGACLYDVWLFDSEGASLEAVLGLAMKDVSGGRLKPPSWFESGFIEPLEILEKNCLGMTLVEIDSPAPFAGRALSAVERERSRKFGPKRFKEFLAARLAVKRLSRKIGLADPHTPADSLHTLNEDPVKPKLPGTQNQAAPCVSVSHSGRYAAAAAADRPVGLDVEFGASKAARGQSIFMNDRERILADRFQAGPEAAAVRIWTVKEAVSKALDIPLPEVWTAAEATEIGTETSRVRIRDFNRTAFHAEIEGHLFTLFLL